MLPTWAPSRAGLLIAPRRPAYARTRGGNAASASTGVGRRREMFADNTSSSVLVAETTLDALQKALGGAVGGQVTVGGVAGFATGYATKRIGQVLFLLVGLEIVALQAMAKRGWVTVDWKLISDELSPHVEKERLERAMDAVKYKMPFAGAFGAGWFAGLRWS